MAAPAAADMHRFHSIYERGCQGRFAGRGVGSAVHRWPKRERSAEPGDPWPAVVGGLATS
jgi:hypothetical protein